MNMENYIVPTATFTENPEAYELVVELPGIAEIATTSIEPQFVRKITKAEYDEALKRGSGVENDNTPPARRTR